MRMNYFKLKFLLLFFALAVAIPPAWAETATLPNTQTLTTEFANVGTDTHIKIKTSSANSYTNPLRFYANTTMTIQADEGYAIQSVTYEASSTGNYVTYAQNATVTPKVTPTVDGKNVTWALNNVSIFTFTPTAQTRANSITITYTNTGGSTTEKVATPTFSPAGGNYNEAQNVTISCATDGAAIHYTTDGSDPDENSVVYSSAINVDKTMTIKAIAMKGGMDNSAIASAEYIIKDPSEVKLYTRVTDLSQLKVGYKYILVNEQKKAFCGAIGKDGNNYGLAVTGPNIETTDGKKVVDISNTEGILEMTLGGNSNGWTFDTGNGYLNYDGNNHNSLHISNDATINGSKWTAADTEFGFVSLQNVGKTDRYIRYNSSSPRFACYTSDQSNAILNAILYVEVKDETPTDDPTIEVDPTRLTINDNNGNNKTGTLTATLTNGQGDLIATTNSSDKWSWANNTVTFNGNELGAEGTVTFSSTGANDVVANLEYNYTGPLYILGTVNDWTSWGANNAVEIAEPDANGIYTVTLTTAAGEQGKSWISFSKRVAENNDDGGWAYIAPYRFSLQGENVNTAYWLTEDKINTWIDLDFDPDHAGNQPLRMDPGQYIITIDAKNNKFKIQKVAGPKIYNKVTHESQLIAGKKYILVYEKTPAFMGAISTTSTTYGLSITGPELEGSSVNIGQYSDIRELTLSGDASGWSFHNGDGYLTWTSGNSLNVVDEITNNAKWTVSSIEDGFILTNVDNTARVLKYNKTSGQQRFACYTQGQESAVLYVEDGVEPSVLPTVATPTFTPSAGTYTEVQNVEINCTTEDATIYYTTDGTVPTTASAVYSTAIEVAQNMTIKAMAVKEGMTNSNVATAEYTINLPITVSTLAAANALEEEGNSVEFTFTENDVVVTFNQSYKTTSNNGNIATHTLIGLRDKSENDKTDGTGKGGSVFFDISDEIANNLTQGTVLNPGWKAKTSDYSGWVQLKSASSVTTQDETVTVKPFDRTGVTLTAANQSEYIILNNVTINGTTATAGTRATYTLFNRFNLEYGNGDYEYLIGVVNIHSNAIEIYPLELKKAKAEAGLTYGEEPVAVTAKIGEDVTEPELTNPNNLTVTYSSSDTNVATVDAEGNVTAVGAGEATITASFAGNDNYLAGEASYTITVTKKDAGLKYEQAEFTVYAGNDFTAPTLVNPNKLSPITYSIEGNDPEIVLFDGEDGTVVVGNKTGTVTITAKFAGDDTYNEATASYTLNIIKKEVATLSFDVEGITVYPNAEDFNQPKLTTTPENLTVTYTSTDDNIATVVDGVLMIGDKIGTTTITATFAGNDTYGTATASYTVTVEPRPIVVADKGVEFELYVGQTETKTFTVMAENLKGDITLTLSESDVFTITPPTIAKADMTEDGVEVTVTYTPKAATGEDFDEATVTLSTKDAEKDATVTLTGMAEVQPVVAMPTFSLVAGSYTGPQQVTIYCATEGATISYSTDGGSTWTKGNTVNVDKDMTIMAKAEKDGMTVSTTASATYVIITEEAPVTVNIETGYYQIKNLGNDQYANVAGRKTLNFTDAPADKAGTVIYVDVENDGTVKSLRSQAADLQRYADRAMSYVPEVVKIVAQKLNADGSGEILGETGLNKILDKFNECFDHNLHVEQAQGGYRLYGKTPSMQPVVEFYRENKDKVEAKLPNLEAFINSALEKLKAKIGGSSVFTEFKLLDIWEKMGGTLTKPVDDASTMAFYREVLNNKNYVWDFAYQTAMIYVNNLMSHPRWPEVEDKLGEYAQYIDKIKQIRPEFKYYIVQKDGKPDFISEGNKDIIDNNPRTIWSLEKRTGFTVNFPEANKHNGEYVTTLYTDFAYTLPEGVTAYTVTEVSTQGVATLTALEGTIPAQTPVLLKSTAAGPQTVTLSTEAGTAPADNLLVGPDYLIKHYEFKTPQVVDIFNFIKDKLPGFYDEYVAQYEYLMLKTAGTVGNKYFWNVNSDLANLKDDCIVRSLAVDENGTLAFSDHWTTETNKAFLVDDANNPQDVIKLSLRGDINKDGVISIIDVTALIDILLDLPARTYLNPTDTYPKGLDYEAADVNENKDIEITDVTTLIDILLNMPDQPAQGSGN